MCLYSIEKANCGTQHVYGRFLPDSAVLRAIGRNIEVLQEASAQNFSKVSVDFKGECIFYQLFIAISKAKCIFTFFSQYFRHQAHLQSEISHRNHELNFTKLIRRCFSGHFQASEYRWVICVCACLIKSACVYTEWILNPQNPPRQNTLTTVSRSMKPATIPSWPAFVFWVWPKNSTSKMRTFRQNRHNFVHYSISKSASLREISLNPTIKRIVEFSLSFFFLFP